MVEGVADLDDVGGRHNRRNDMVDATEGVECLVEQTQHRLVLCHICRIEDCSRGDAGFVEGWPSFTAPFDELLAFGAVHVTDTDVGTALAAELRETGSGTIGTAWQVRQVSRS